MTDLVGRTLGHFHILESLGEGGMAAVYKAMDTRLERFVALKIIRPDRMLMQGFVPRFQREARVLARLVHPHIVHISDYGEQDGIWYLVMDYLPGGTLKARLGKPIPYREAARLLLPIAQALEYAHENHIIHRDVKPSNILLTVKGQPMLSDFGLAKILESADSMSLSSSGFGVGTPEYMAPEQWLGKAVPQTDIYALGVVFFEMLTGQKPYTADTPAAILLKQAHDPLPRPRSFVPNLPDAVELVIFKALAKDPKERYPSMHAFAEALERIALGQIQEMPPIEDEDATPREPVIIFQPNPPQETPAQPPAALPERGLTTTVLPQRRRVSPALLIGVILAGAAGLLWLLNRTLSAAPSQPLPTPVPTRPVANLLPAAPFEPVLQRVLLADDFDDPQMDGAYNPYLWQFNANGYRIARQTDGAFRMQVLPDQSVSLTYPQSLPVTEMNYFDARFLVLPYDRGGDAATAINISLEGMPGWHLACDFNNGYDLFSCFYRSGGGEEEYNYFVTGQSPPYDQWFRVQMLIDPATFEVRVYLNDALAGSVIPEPAEEWKSHALWVSFTANGITNPAALVSYFDDILVAKAAFDDSPAGSLNTEWKGKAVFEDDFDNPIFNTAFDPTKWSYTGLFPQQGGQKDGVFQVFLQPQVTNASQLLISQPAWYVQEANRISLRFRFSLPEEKKWAGPVLIVQRPDQPGGEWKIECTISPLDNSGRLSCYSNSTVEPPGEYTDFEMIPSVSSNITPEEWHTFTLLIEPHSFLANVYLDGALAAYQLPRRSGEWLSHPYRLMFGVLAGEEGLTQPLGAEYDDVWVGTVQP